MEDLSDDILAAKSDIMKAVEGGFETLQRIWAEIGIDRKSMSERIVQVVNHHVALQTEMVTEEVNMLEVLKANVRKAEKEIASLSAKLGVDSVDATVVKEESRLLEQEKLLNAQLDGLRLEKNNRIQKVRQLVENEQTSCKCLGIETIFHDIGESDVPEQNQMMLMVQRVDALKEKQKTLLLKYDNLKKTVFELISELEIVPSNDLEFELQSNNPKCLSDGFFEKITTRIDELKSQMDQNRLKIGILRPALEIMWDVFNIDQLQRTQLLENNTKSSGKTIAAYEKELHHFRKLKLENIATFIPELRNQLTYYWDKCFVRTEDRNTFSAFSEVSLTENVLEQHEEEVRKWKTHYEQNKTLYEAFIERDVLSRRISELLCATRDRDTKRYTNRGGLLLKEEKERKSLNRRWLKLEENLDKLTADYENRNGKPFQINGKTLQEIRERKDPNQNQRPIFINNVYCGDFGCLFFF